MNDATLAETRASLIAQLDNPHLSVQEIQKIERKLKILDTQDA